jgi:hypothetical protein
MFTAADARIFRIQKIVPGILNKTEHGHISSQNSVTISMQRFLLHILGVRDELYGEKFPRSYSVSFVLLRFVQETI